MTNESSSESSDSSSDSDVNDYGDNEHKLREEITALRLQLESFPNSYELHTRLINSLRKLGNLDELNAARENMNVMYPLSPKLWLDWIEDERKIAMSDDEKRKVEGLFKRAVEDYDDPSIWQEYCLFAIGNLQPGSAESIRATEHIFETALSHQGLNVATANSLWEMYRDLQLVLFGQQNPSSLQLTEDRLKCIDKLYRRQLRLPLLAMESTLEAYEEFLKHSGSNLYPQHDQASSVVPPDCMKEYEKAKTQLSLLLPFEERIEATSTGPETDSVAAWEAYLDWIVTYPRGEPSDGGLKRKSKSLAEEFPPNHICCLFERAVTAHCLQATIWLRFVNYLEDKLPSDRQRLLHVLARSVRNCPWSVDLWLHYALVSELWVNDELLQTASNGLENHVDRPALERSAFAKVEVVFESALSAGLEQQPDLMKIWLAYCDYRLRRLMSAQPSTAQWDEQLNNLRSIFQHIRLSDYLRLEYSALGNYGDSKHLFRLCRMAVNSISSASEADHAFPTLLRLASEAALTVTQIHELVMRIRTRRVELARRAAIEEAKFPDSGSFNIKSQRAVTRGAVSVCVWDCVLLYELTNYGWIIWFVYLFEHFVHCTLLVSTVLPHHSKSFPSHASSGVFQSIHGKVVSVRLACYRNGAPKGHAYVEFSDANEASRALIATDGLLLQSKRIAVAISNPPVRKSAAFGTPVDSTTSKQAVSQNVNDVRDFRAPNAPADIGSNQRTHSRTQLAFLPRAINLHAMSSASEIEDKNDSEAGEPSESVTKSNADFRKMFLS
ncbi:hypothetical protein AHF37_07981 [Paragonimus kellicotti]|nr:hypothetical protein AHF37_07981 [Paragonimus kellicotti]